MYDDIESQAVTPTATEVVDINSLVAINTHNLTHRDVNNRYKQLHKNNYKILIIIANKNLLK